MAPILHAIGSRTQACCPACQTAVETADDADGRAALADFVDNHTHDPWVRDTLRWS